MGNEIKSSSLKNVWKKMNISDLLSERDRSCSPNKLLQKIVHDQNRVSPSKKSGAARTPRPDPAKLNQQFARDIVRLEQSIGALEFREKLVATEWIARLKVPTQKGNEAEARNMILDYLLACSNENVFSKPPFNEPPPQAKLEVIKQLIPPGRTVCPNAKPLDYKNNHLSELYRDSYDNGEFLSRLPVPRDGAFFILHLRPNL